MDDAISSEPAAGDSSRLGALTRKLHALSSKRSFLALLDQAFVSGTSLLTTIVVGRYCGAEGLGLFSLAISSVILARGMQETLVSAPYTVFRSRIGDRMTPAQYAGGALIGAMLLAAIVTGVVIITAVAFTATSHPGAVRMLIWALVIAVPFALAREFARRFDMAHLDMLGALKVDATVGVVQVTLLFALAWRDQLSSAAAVLIIGLACAVVTLTWAARRRNKFSIRRESLRWSIKHDWGFGRWLLADQLICFAQLYAMHWILAAMLGTSATGVFTACASIAALASPLLQGIGNYLSPRFAEAASTGTREETQQLYWKATAALALPVTLFAGVATFFGEELLWLLYHDAAYHGYGVVVGVLAFRMAFGIPAIAAHHAVVAMEKPRRSAAATLIGLLVTICVAFPLIHLFGVLGAAIAVFAGTGCECLALIVIFSHCLRDWRWPGDQNPPAETIF